MSCPTFENLVDFADGRLVGDDVSLVENHLAGGCDACRGALAWYRGVVDTAAGDTSVEPPAWVTRRALDLFRQGRASRGLRGLVSRLRAALVFDSLTAGPDAELAPARSGAGPSRQLLYTASPYDVDLLISAGADPRRLTVTGQVLVSESEDFGEVGGLTVELADGDTVAGRATTSEFGEFTVEGVQPGLYEVRLVGPNREIVLTRAPIALD